MSNKRCYYDLEATGFAFIPPLLHYVFLTIIALVLLFTAVDLFIVDTATSTEDKLAYRYTLVILASMWLALKRGKFLPSSIPQEPTKAITQFVQNITVLLSFLCLAKVLADISPDLRGLFFSHSTQPGTSASNLSGNLLSAGAVILAVTTGYFLWALVRTEEQAKKLINEMTEKNARIIEIEEKLASEEMVRANTLALTHIMDVQGRALKNITDQLAEGNPAMQKQLALYDPEIVYCGKLLSLVSMSRMDNRVTLKDQAFVFWQQYCEIRNHHQQTYGGQDWSLIQPSLSSTVTHLKTLFPNRDETGTQYIWQLIDEICDDIGINPEEI